MEVHYPQQYPQLFFCNVFWINKLYVVKDVCRKCIPGKQPTRVAIMLLGYWEKSMRKCAARMKVCPPLQSFLQVVTELASHRIAKLYHFLLEIKHKCNPMVAASICNRCSLLMEPVAIPNVFSSDIHLCHCRHCREVG